MTTTITAPRNAVPALPDKPTRLHRPLLWVSIALAALVPVAILGALFDDRVLLGHPIWMKPLKFAISLAAYCAALAWMLSLQRRARRVGWWMGTIIAAGIAVEMVLVMIQVVFRGRQLHFNMSTPADALIHNIMPTAIYLVWGAMLVVAIQLLFDKPGDRALRWSIRLALGTTLAGMLLANLMFRATPAQEREAAEAGEQLHFGSHSVGVEDGGAGLPITGWSTEGGDLRIGHFLGVHALQAIPLLALGLVLLARRFQALRPEGPRTALVIVGAASYGGLMWLVTWQAQRGESIVHPGAATLTAVAWWLGATILTSLLVLFRARRTTLVSTSLR
jgi:hypothetical protein